MAEVAFLGLGAMGARMAERLLRAGHGLRVWNRTPGRADPLVAAGAIRARTPAAAAAGAEMVVSMVRDDAASLAVWTDAFTAMRAGATGIEMSTISPAHASILHAAAADRNIAFLDAPVAGSRPQADAGQLVFMVGGAERTLDMVRPLLLEMGREAHHAGGPAAGAAVKLMLNALFGTQVALMAELIGLSQRLGVDPGRAVEIIGATPVGSIAATVSARAMLARSFAPAFPIDLVEKDFRLVDRTGAAVAADLPISRAVGAIYAAANDAGHGGENITAVARRFLDPAADVER